MADNTIKERLDALDVGFNGLIFTQKLLMAGKSKLLKLELKLLHLI